LPALNHNEARDIARASGAGARSVLAGELHGEELPGFAQPTPQALSHRDCRAKPSLRDHQRHRRPAPAQAGRAVYALALRNAARHVDALTRQPDGTLILLCAGSAGAFNIEDFYTAGVLVRHFVSLVKAAFLSTAPRPL